MPNRSDSWDKRYKKEDAHLREDPSELLIKWTPFLPEGRALDVACGAGRNSIFLAENGYEVDAIDYSEQALKIARERAEKKELKVNWILEDLSRFNFPKEEYSVIIISFYRLENNWREIKNSLKEGGYILYEHHLNSDQEVERGPKNPRFRFYPNELLQKFSDLQVLYYQEGIEKNEKGASAAKLRLVARKTKNPTSGLPPIF